MTAGNRQRFIIINLHACIRIYDVTLPSPLSFVVRLLVICSDPVAVREISFSIRD